jgi:hypothetical protein
MDHGMDSEDWRRVDELVAADASSERLEAAARRWRHRPALAAQLRRQVQRRAAEEEFEGNPD